MSYIQERNKKIGDNARATRLRHSTMVCKTYKFKIDYRHLNKEQQTSLKMMFVESKWIYNWILGQENIDVDYKDIVDITHKDKDGNDVNVTIKHVKTSVKQQLIAQIKEQIKGLSVLKKKGHKVGRLRFKSEFNSIPLKQYNVTHSIRGNCVKIQGINKPLRMLGINQLNNHSSIDYTVAKLIYDGHDYYFSLTCYIPKKDDIIYNKIRGIDMGVSTTVTTSDGVKYNVMVEESERIKKLQRKLLRQKKGSNNYYKTRLKLKYAYIKLSNKKRDKANKVVHDILTGCDTVVMQDEQIAGWKTEFASDRNSKIQHSCLGAIKRKLIESHKTVVLDRWYPTTQWCPLCGSNTKLNLSDRTFVCCNCHNTEDRDIHAANNMIAIYLNYKDASGTGGTSKPVKKISFKEDFLRSRKMQCL